MARLSITVCSHNLHSDYLARVLRALAAQTSPTAQWEELLLLWHPRALWSNDARDRVCVPWDADLCVTRTIAQAHCKLVNRLDSGRLLDRCGPQLFGRGNIDFSWVADRARGLIASKRLQPLSRRPPS
jgi:hypothetical protein